MSTEIQITIVIIFVVAFLAFLKFGGAKIIVLLIAAGIVAAIVFASMTASIQKTVQAPADSVNSTLSTTSLSTSNAAAIASLAMSNASAQSALSMVACVLPVIILVIVCALAYVGIRYTNQKWSAKHVQALSQVNAQQSPTAHVRQQTTVAPARPLRVSRRQRRNAGAKIAGRWFR